MATLKRTRLVSINQTVDAIIRMVKLYHADVEHYPHIANLNLFAWFDYVSALEFRSDMEVAGEEFVSRPLYTLDPGWGGPRDCDDKTVLVLVWPIRNGFRWRVVVAGDDGADVWHVFPELFVSGHWLPVDATYSTNRIFVDYRPTVGIRRYWYG